MQSDELGLLITALGKKDSGFYLVEAPDNTTLYDLMIKIKVALGRSGKSTAVIDFSKRGPVESISEFVSQTVDRNSNAQVLFLKNLVPLKKDDAIEFLRKLNHAREAIYALNRNFVFLVYPYLTDLIMKYARDLFSWIPQRYSFEGQPFTPRDLARSLRMEEHPKFVGDTDRIYINQLIDLFKEQLKEAAGDPELTIQITGSLADLYHQGGDYEREIPLRLQLMEYHIGDEVKHAEALVGLADAYAWSNGDEGREKAITLYGEALNTLTPERNKRVYANALCRLGETRSRLMHGNRDKNQLAALENWSEALKVVTKSDNPVEYASIMWNLGFAYSQWATGDVRSNQESAVHCLQEALDFYTPHDFPVPNAILKVQLGLALSKLGIGNTGNHFQRAISFIREALSVLTYDTFKNPYAHAQLSLGYLYLLLPIGIRAENLKESRLAFEAALKVYTPESFPEEYAYTMKGLHTVMAELARQDQEKEEWEDKVSEAQ
ncbi:MAG: hypothetical protein HQK59_04720 [Deltaproteobacteria bacterium]|nr:hypothetical protein [Deltaproteobacteria bacterium]